MIRSPSLMLACVLAALFVGAGPAGAGGPACRLHVQGRLGESGRVLDLNVPWQPGKGGSPFDFTDDVSDDVGLDRLRTAWGTLRRLPEGQAVTIATREDEIRAWRRGGYLVLEPHRHADGDVTHVKIPDYIVEAILAHDGRLTGEDIDRLVRERGKATIVKLKSEKGELNVWVDRSAGDL